MGSGCVEICHVSFKAVNNRAYKFTWKHGTSPWCWRRVALGCLYLSSHHWLGGETGQLLLMLISDDVNTCSILPRDCTWRKLQLIQDDKEVWVRCVILKKHIRCWNFICRRRLCKGHEGCANSLPPTTWAILSASFNVNIRWHLS